MSRCCLLLWDLALHRTRVSGGPMHLAIVSTHENKYLFIYLLLLVTFKKFDVAGGESHG
jgi:hypothetical protein